ncbi:Shikimate 5-dehydrogenase I alpha [Minicystis rosea]|nr:Shikimate 5-dehydrogenase I alpha [Minicystis rosea]
MSRKLRFSLLGHPVRHSVSPIMCGAAFAALGLPHVYTAIDVPSEAGLTRILEDLRAGTIAGCNVTIPYKRAVFAAADLRAASANEVGAANVLVRADRGRIMAHNTDADALAQDLGALLDGRPRLRAAIIGGGGAALAALIACRKLGFKVVCAASRSWSSSEAVLESATAQAARAMGALTMPWPRSDGAAPSGKLSQAMRLQWSELAEGADCVIQATSAGMHGADPGEDVSTIVPWSKLPAHAVVYDVVYNPRETPFLRSARAHGLTAEGGLGMLVRQAALSIQLWTGLTPPLDHMRRAAEEALDARSRTP